MHDLSREMETKEKSKGNIRIQKSGAEMSHAFDGLLGRPHRAGKESV